MAALGCGPIQSTQHSLRHNIATPSHSNSLAGIADWRLNMRLVLIALLLVIAILVGAGYLNFMQNSNVESHHIDPATIRGK